MKLIFIILFKFIENKEEIFELFVAPLSDSQYKLICAHILVIYTHTHMDLNLYKVSLSSLKIVKNSWSNSSINIEKIYLSIKIV